MNKVILILLGVVIGSVLLFIGAIISYILKKYLDIIFGRIDEYFDTMEDERIAKEINEFKKNL